ncbi:MAG: hypothetical protein ACRDC9_11650 [Plesiomonas shigelloides]
MLAAVRWPAGLTDQSPKLHVAEKSFYAHFKMSLLELFVITELDAGSAALVQAKNTRANSKY